MKRKKLNLSTASLNWVGLAVLFDALLSTAAFGAILTPV